MNETATGNGSAGRLAAACRDGDHGQQHDGTLSDAMATHLQPAVTATELLVFAGFGKPDQQDTDTGLQGQSGKNVTEPILGDRGPDFPGGEFNTARRGP